MPRTESRARGLTQEAAAHQAKIDYKRWQRIENGEANITMKTLLRVCKVCDTSAPNLFRGFAGAKKRRGRGS